MALIKCPECGKEISDKADKCPHCGCPVNISAAKTPEKLVCKPGFFDSQPIKGMVIDKKNKTFHCGFSEIHSFDDIIDVDIFENGSSLTKTSTVSTIGRAAIGSMLNPVGAIIGGVTAKKKSVEIVDTLEVQITVRSELKPLIKIKVPIPKKTKKDSKDYQKAITTAKEYVAVIKNLQLQ